MTALPNYTAELGERVVSAMYRENIGPNYKRAGVIVDRAIEAHIEASLKESEVCPFSNQYGYCKLEVGHSGSHTVIYLGADD